MEDSWLSPDLKELQVEGKERDCFLELLMFGSSPDKAVEGSSVASSKESQLAQKGVAQKGKPATSKGKGRSNGGTPKGGSEPSVKPKKEENGVRSGGKLKEPNSRGQEAPPDPSPR
jgi:hypothetical protein